LVLNQKYNQMIFGINKTSGKTISKMLSGFILELGEEHELIMYYCLGPNWRNEKVEGSHNHFNEKLGIDLNPMLSLNYYQGSDDIIKSASKIKKAWQTIKRDNLLDEILN